MPLYRVTTYLNNTSKTPCDGYYIYTGETYNIDDANYIYGYENKYQISQIGYSFDVYYTGTQGFIYVFVEHCDNHVNSVPNSTQKRQGGYQVQLIKLDSCLELGPPLPSPALSPTPTPTPTPTPLNVTNICIQIEQTEGQEPSPQCVQNDFFIDYVFTLKNSSGLTINAPQNIEIKINAEYSPSGGIGYITTDYIVTIFSGTSSNFYRLYTFQANDSSPACPCPCEVTNSVNFITATNNISGYNITICGNNT